MHEDSRERTYEKVLREASVTASGSRTAPAIAG
jgi:hypothetical protein